MKTYIKLILGIIFSIISITTSFAYIDIETEVAHISAQKETFYTLYLGMPEKELKVNFADILEWDKEFYKEPFKYGGHIERLIYDGNIKITELISIDQARQDGTVYQFSIVFSTNDKKTAAKIYKQLYAVMKNRYPNFSESVPFGYGSWIREDWPIYFINASHNRHIALDLIDASQRGKGDKYAVRYTISAVQEYIENDKV